MYVSALADSASSSTETRKRIRISGSCTGRVRGVLHRHKRQRGEGEEASSRAELTAARLTEDSWMGAQTNEGVERRGEMLHFCADSRGVRCATPACQPTPPAPAGQTGAARRPCSSAKQISHCPLQSRHTPPATACCPERPLHSNNNSNTRPDCSPRAGSIQAGSEITISTKTPFLITFGTLVSMIVLQLMRD